MCFHQFLSDDPVCYLRLVPACQAASRRDDKAIISPIQQLSHAVAEQVTINFLPWQCRHCTLNRDYISLSIFIWKCISRKRPCTRSCAHNPFDSPQRGPRAVSRQVSGKPWIVTNCSRWQLNADDGERALHPIAHTFECVHFIMLPYIVTILWQGLGQVLIRRLWTPSFFLNCESHQPCWEPHFNPQMSDFFLRHCTFQSAS